MENIKSFSQNPLENDTITINVSEIGPFIKEAIANGYEPHNTEGNGRYLVNRSPNCGWSTISVSNPWLPLPESGTIEVTKFLHNGDNF